MEQVPSSTPSRGYFQDRYFNGSAVNVQGCEGFAALFCGVATDAQAAAMAAVLGDPSLFLLNFSLPTVSKADPHFDPTKYSPRSIDLSLSLSLSTRSAECVSYYAFTVNP